MAHLLKHNDVLSFRYYDSLHGLIIASYKVVSIISEAISLNQDPIEAIRIVGDRESIVLVRQPADQDAKLIPGSGTQNVVCEGKRFVLHIDGPNARLERVVNNPAQSE